MPTPERPRFGVLAASSRWHGGEAPDPSEPWVKHWTARGADGAAWRLVTDEVVHRMTLWCRPAAGGEFRYELELVTRFAVGEDGSLDIRFRSEEAHGLLEAHLDPVASIDVAHLPGDPGLP